MGRMKKLLTLLIFFTSFPGLALDSDSKLPIGINADSVQFDKKKGIGIYQGHLQLKQGTTIVEADFGKTWSNVHGQLIKVMIQGKPARYRTMLEVNQPEFIATGDTMILYPKTHWVYIIGHAQLVQGQDHFSAPRIAYNIAQQILKAPASSKGRTYITIHSLTQ
jgi:lipopolysaccharide export system protein LptA